MATPPPPQPPSALRVTIRLDLPSGARIGHGKVALLEAIAREGSIAAAARVIGMSYPRAWALVREVDAALGVPAVMRAPGGRQGGGATVTSAGQELVRCYRAVEEAAQQAAGRSGLASAINGEL